jgi:hypothetical protein
VNERWLVYNIAREVGNGRETLFWRDSWLDGVLLEVSYRRLFELAENKLVTVADAKVMGWGESWEARRWCRSPYAWENELLRECVDRLANVILHMEMADPWVWNLHSSKQYTVKSAYGNLTSIDLDFNVGFKHVLWLKMVPLAVADLE